jgi:hypothetical protein
MPRFFTAGLFLLPGDEFLWILSRPVFTIIKKRRRILMKRRRLVLVLSLLSVMFLFLSAQPLFAAERTVKFVIPDCG